jgi:CRISPR-associated exonuclease Cas4
MKSKMKMLSSSESEISVGDIKQYLYCPRVVYYTHVMKVPKPRDVKLNAGKTMHMHNIKLESKRKGALFYSHELEKAQKQFKVKLFSERLGLNGLLDCLIITEKERIPVEYKLSGYSKEPHRSHKYQLTGYALLIEDTWNCIVRRGFLYYADVREVVEVKFTQRLKDSVKMVLKEIRRMLNREYLPEPTRISGRCIDCEYKSYCTGV